MNNKINIDELLKEELGHLAPEPPPGVWESVGNQLQAVQQAAQVSGSVAQAGKTALLGSKIIITAAVVAVTSIAGYLGVKTLLNNEKPPMERSGKQETPASTKTETVANPVKEQPEVTERNTSPVSESGTVYKVSGREMHVRKTQAEKSGSQPAGEADRKDKVMDLTDPLIVSDRQVKPQIDNNASGQEIHTQEQPVAETETLNHEPEQEFQAPFIPNVFTPNDDGKNDEFDIVLENEVLYDLKITDRKGNIVFESKDKNMHWKGIDMYTGKTCDEGMYIYAFKYQLKGMKEAESVSGWINLRRSARQ